MAAPIPSLPPQDAMAIIGFTPAEVTALLEVTAVVLKLGNVELSSCFQASGMEASSIAEPQGTVGRGGSDGPPPIPAQQPQQRFVPHRAAGDQPAGRAGPQHSGAGAVLTHCEGAG